MLAGLFRTSNGQNLTHHYLTIFIRYSAVRPENFTYFVPCG